MALSVPQTHCVVVGGGPAGMICGYILARAGIAVTVLEKHKDFLRDFRGDTIHPSTLDVLAELGLLDEFLKRPHQSVKDIRAQIGKEEFTVGDFRHVPARCKFLALMPQWGFLNLIAEKAEALDTFTLVREAEVTQLIEEDRHIAGVIAQTKNGTQEFRGDLVIGADGRHSVVRKAAKCPVRDLGAPIDVLWMRLPRKDGDPDAPMGRFEAGGIFVMIYRGDYWQCALVIAKGGYDKIKAQGLNAFRARLRSLAGFAGDRVNTIQSWDDVKLLTVTVDRAKHWARPGMLIIGDAAHAMSPIGGVGINLAIQDAVAAANILGPILQHRAPVFAELQRVQKRRLWPVRIVQWVQVQIQNRVMTRTLAETGAIKAPWPVRLLNAVPYLRRFPAWFIGVGVRPEHVTLKAKM